MILAEDFDINIEFDKMWRSFPLWWGEKGQELGQDICNKIMSDLKSSSYDFNSKLNIAHAAAQYYGAVVPKQYLEIINEAIDKLAPIILKYIDFEYVGIQFDLALQGNNKFIPDISIYAGHKDFTSEWPWNPEIRYILSHKFTNYPGWQGSIKNPLPTPQFDDYLDIIRFPRASWFSEIPLGYVRTNYDRFYFIKTPNQ